MPLFWLLMFFTVLLDEETVKPGETVSGVIERSDPILESKDLNRVHPADRVQGRGYILDGLVPGRYTLLMRSLCFNTYLVLRNDEGEVLAEDDDGFFLTHSRLVFDADQEAERYSVAACALHGFRGPFELKLIRGEVPELAPPEKEAAVLEEIGEVERLAGEQEGTNDPLIATMLDKYGSALQEMGRYEKAGSLLERALSIREEALGARHPQTAMSLHNLAVLQGIRGRYAEAERLLKQALDIVEETLGEDHPDTATCCNSLGVNHWSRGNFEAALLHLGRVVSYRERILGSEHPDTATALFNLGSVLQFLGNLEEAKIILERALEIRLNSFDPEHPRVADSLASLASLYRITGEYVAAERLFLQSLDIREKALGPDHPVVAQTCNNLAELYRTIGNLAAAEALFRRSMEIVRNSLGPEHRYMATCLNNLALIHYALGDHAAAEPLFRQSLAIGEKNLGPDHQDLAFPLLNLAAIHQDRGDLASADSLLRRSLEISENALGPNHPDVAQSLNNLALLRRAQGDHVGSKSLFMRSLAIRERALGSDHTDAAQSLIHLALLLSDMGEEARALELSRKAVASAEVQLHRLLWSLTESEGFTYAGQKRTMLEIFLSLAPSISTKVAGEAAYETLLRWKGRVSRSLRKSRERLLHDLDPRKRSLLDQIRSTQSAISKLVYQADASQPEVVEEKLARLQDRRHRLEDRLLYLAGRDEEGRQAPTVEALRAALPEKAVLVDFFIHRWYRPAERYGRGVPGEGRWSAPHLTAWIVIKGDGEIRHIDLGPAAPISDAVRFFLEQGLASQEGSSPGSSDLAMARTANNTLHTLLWKPLAGHLRGAATIILSPDLFLGTLPLETLRLEDGRYLIEKHAVVYLQDTTSMIESAERTAAKRDGSLLVVGGVDYDSRADIDGQERSPRMALPGSRSGRNSGKQVTQDDSSVLEHRKWKTLPGTLQEMETIADLHRRLFREKVRRLEIRGEAATEERITAELPRFGTAHIATHGYSRPRRLTALRERIGQEGGGSGPDAGGERGDLDLSAGLLSGLVLAGANARITGLREDGLLTADEIEWLDLSGVELLVLSACETGLGWPTHGEGLLGLGRTILQAGARGVVTSLWKVDDRAASLFFSKFYNYLWAEKMHPAAALRRVKLDMIHGRIVPEGLGAGRSLQQKPQKKPKDYASPYFWGSFVYHGRDGR